MLNNCRTTRNKKVPSFGSSSESRTKPESEDASSSASAATVVSETEKDDEDQTDSTNNTDEAEDTFLQRVISDLTEEMSDEMESKDVQEGVTAESVSKEPALVENIMMEDTLCQVKSSCQVLKALLWYYFMPVKRNYNGDHPQMCILEAP